MGKLWMPMNNFKKVSEDNQSATLQHPDGHQIKLAKNILSPHMKEQLAALPMHEGKPSKPNLARGGRVRKMDAGGLSCGACGSVQQNGQNTGVPNPMPQQQQQQPSGPTNAQIPQMQSQGPSADTDPYNKGLPGIFQGQSASGLINKGYQEQLGGAKTAMQAQQSGEAQAAGAAGQGAQLLQQNLHNFYNGWQAPDGRHVPGYLETLQENDAIKQDVLTHQIDPNRYINSGAMPKILTALGLLGSMSKNGGGEQILGFVQNQMHNDIAAQMADRSGKMNVLQANMQQLGNMRDAMTATGTQYQSVLVAMLEQAAHNTNSQMAKANYMNAAGMIHQNMAKQIYDWKMGQVQGMNVGANQGGQGQGGQGGASAGGAQPTDAVGNPLGRGMNINPGYYSQMNPVKLPGGGYGFAGQGGDAAQKAGDANKAVIAHQQLDDAIKQVQQAQSTGPAFPSVFGMMDSDRAKKASAMDQLHNAVRNVVSGGGRLTPYQQDALKNLSNISENPIIFGRGTAQQKLQDLGNTNNDTVNSVLGSDVNNYTAPAKPKINKKFTQ